MGKNHKDPARSSWVNFHVSISAIQGQGGDRRPICCHQLVLLGSDVQLCHVRIRGYEKGQDAFQLVY